MRTTFPKLFLLSIVFALVSSSALAVSGNILANIPTASNGYPAATPVFDSAGNLFFSVAGYALTDGSIVEASPTSGGQWNLSIIHAFSGLDGRHPASSLVFDGAGNLYGTTFYGGTADAGVVFKLTPTGNGQWTESVIYNFGGAGNLAIPSSGLIFDSAGNLYGVTSIGGKGTGAVYELSPDGNGNWTETTIYGFDAFEDGVIPFNDLVFDASGNLYGTTSNGGRVNSGIVYRLTPGTAGWTETILYDFSANGDGMVPSGVVLDSAGNLYGTTYFGGMLGGGRLYKLSPASGFWRETVIHDFGAALDGTAPRGELVFDAHGRLYGATYGGGIFGEGTVYRFSPVAGGGWKGRILHQFPYDAFDGFSPDSGPILDNAGNLYGLTPNGGKFGIGVAYRITPN